MTPTPDYNRLDWAHAPYFQQHGKNYYQGGEDTSNESV